MAEETEVAAMSERTNINPRICLAFVQEPTEHWLCSNEYVRRKPSTHVVNLEPTSPTIPPGNGMQLEEMFLLRETHRAHSVQEKPTVDKQVQNPRLVWSTHKEVALR